MRTTRHSVVCADGNRDVEKYLNRQHSLEIYTAPSHSKYIQCMLITHAKLNAHVSQPTRLTTIRNALHTL